METQASMSEIFKQVLGVGEISADADFYDEGGTSLQAFAMLGKIQETFGVQLPMMYILQDVTVRSMSALVDNMLSKTNNNEEKFK